MKQLTNDENWAKKMPKMTDALEVKKQQSAVGRGLFVRKKFPSGFESGDAIGEYVGERILEDEYQVRIEQYKAEKEFNYFVEVAADCVTGLYIDATKKGNWTRFVNNSHEPNAQFEPVVISGTWRIYLVAMKKIKAGDEVTIDYGAEYRSPDQKFVECFCPSKHCSGVIGVPLDKRSISKLLLKDLHYEDDDLNTLCGENRVLEAHNKQLLLQQKLIKERVAKVFDEVFVPLTDHRPVDEVHNNRLIVQDLLNEDLAMTGQPAIEHSPSDFLPSGSNRVAAINGPNSGLRTNSRVSSKRSAGGDSDDGEQDKKTPPPKKIRKSPPLTICKTADCTIESSVSHYPASSFEESRLTPSPTASTSKSTGNRSRHISESDDDLEIIDVTPALPAPTRHVKPNTPPKAKSSAQSCIDLKQTPKNNDHSVATTSGSSSSVISQPTSIIEQVIDWYKTVNHLPLSLDNSQLLQHPCPAHKSEKFTKMREVRKHFFLLHWGAANRYKQQFDQVGKCLTESEKKLFKDSQSKRNACNQS